MAEGEVERWRTAPHSETALHALAATFIKGLVERHIVRERSSHEHGGMERAQINAGAHAGRSPKLDVVGVVVGFFDPSFMSGVPGHDAVV